MYIYLNIKTFSYLIFINYYIITIIIKLYLLFIIQVYTPFQDLYVAINIYVLKEDYTINKKCLKKNKKEEL